MNLLGVNANFICTDELCNSYLKNMISIEENAGDSPELSWNYILQNVIEVNQFYEDAMSSMKESTSKEVLASKIKIFILHYFIYEISEIGGPRVIDVRENSPFYRYAMH